MMILPFLIFPHLVIVCTHQHTATSVPILVLVVVTLSSHNVVGGGWSSATPYSVGVSYRGIAGIEETRMEWICRWGRNIDETTREDPKRYSSQVWD